MQGWQAWGGDSASVSERTAEEQPPPPQQPPVERQPQQRQQDCVELLLARLGDDDEDHADEHQAEGHAVPVGVAALVDESAEGDLWHTCRRTTCANVPRRRVHGALEATWFCAIWCVKSRQTAPA